MRRDESTLQQSVASWGPAFKILLEFKLDTVRIFQHLDTVKTFSYCFGVAPISLTSPRKSYHHGDLRNALLSAAREVLDEEGIEGLSLRSLARRAQVSRAAPYHYFHDKAELIAAVVADCYSQLEQRLQTAMTTESALDPVDRVVALGRIYVEFATADPARFRLMHRPELSGNDSAAAQGAFSVLRESVEVCHKAGRFRQGSVDEHTVGCWCAIHGIATLLVDGRLRERVRDPGSFAEEVARTYCRGLAIN